MWRSIEAGHSHQVERTLTAVALKRVRQRATSHSFCLERCSAGGTTALLPAASCLKCFAHCDIAQTRPVWRRERVAGLQPQAAGTQWRMSTSGAYIVVECLGLCNAVLSLVSSLGSRGIYWRRTHRRHIRRDKHRRASAQATLGVLAETVRTQTYSATPSLLCCTCCHV